MAATPATISDTTVAMARPGLEAALANVEASRRGVGAYLANMPMALMNLGQAGVGGTGATTSSVHGARGVGAGGLRVSVGAGAPGVVSPGGYEFSCTQRGLRLPQAPWVDPPASAAA